MRYSITWFSTEISTSEGSSCLGSPATIDCDRSEELVRIGISSVAFIEGTGLWGSETILEMILLVLVGWLTDNLWWSSEWSSRYNPAGSS